MSIALPSGASLVAQMIKNPPACRRTGFNPWVGKIPWRREWQPTPLFLPEQFHGQRSLADPSPWGCKESDTIEQLTLTRLECLRETGLILRCDRKVGNPFQTKQGSRPS